MKSHTFDPNTIRSLHVPVGTEIVYLQADKLITVSYPSWDVDLIGNRLFVEPPSNAPEAAVQMKDVVSRGTINISNVSTGTPSDRIPVIIMPESHKDAIQVRYF